MSWGGHVAHIGQMKKCLHGSDQKTYREKTKAYVDGYYNDSLGNGVQM